jgi:hypothetical protein
MRTQLAVLGLLLCVTATSCVPLTLSRTGAVDFETYQTVLVQVTLTGSTGAGYADYLIAEMRDGSGFATVTKDSQRDVDATLLVRVTLDEDFDGDDIDYDATANFELLTPKGAIIDRGTLDANSEFADEAVEDALDLVANHYLSPYLI